MFVYMCVQAKEAKRFKEQQKEEDKHALKQVRYMYMYM